MTIAIVIAVALGVGFILGVLFAVKAASNFNPFR